MTPIAEQAGHYIDAGDIHHCMNTAFLLGGVDMGRWLAFRYGEPDAFAAFMTRRNPRASQDINERRTVITRILSLDRDAQQPCGVFIINLAQNAGWKT
jgi:hypothetical protein